MASWSPGFPLSREWRNIVALNRRIHSMDEPIKLEIFTDYV
jgi:hypothetical protein